MGLGYVGLANAICLAQNNTVTAVELCSEKVKLVNEGKSPIDDPEIIDYLANRSLDLVATNILAAGADLIEVYRLSMKAGSDNFRSSAIVEIIERLKKARVKVVIYEPNLPDEMFMGCEETRDFEHFKLVSDVIV